MPKNRKTMNKIFKAPKGFNAPNISKYQNNFNQYWKDCEKYVGSIKKALKDNYRSTCKEAGEEITFPVGDGKARYIVATLKPVQLIHVDTGDAWHYQYIHRLTAADIRNEIKSQKAFNKLFSKRS